jgi:hypothetical protein
VVVESPFLWLKLPSNLGLTIWPDETNNRQEGTKKKEMKKEKNIIKLGAVESLLSGQNHLKTLVITS